MAEWIGQTFDSYEILELIGQGAMGPVYKARDKRLERFVALRLPPPQLVGDVHFLERFRREAAAGTKFTHKNLVQIYDIGLYHRMPYVVMELVEGESLAARLARKGRLPPADALAIILYVAKALGAAWNETRLVHLSLKPSSLLVARDGEIKLTDLGFARHAERDDTELPAPDAEAARFASPEVARSEKHLDLRADIYSLGCILFHTITGQMHVLGTPFRADLLPPDSPPGLAKLLGAMLAADPDQRPDSYNTLLTDLWQLDQHLISAAAPAAPPALPTPPHHRPLWPRYAIAVFVLLLFAGWLTWAALKVKQIIVQHLGSGPAVTTKATPSPIVTNKIIKPPLMPPSIKPTLPYAKWQEPINLLALLDPKRDSVTGQWTRGSNTLIGDVAKKQRTARIEIPYEPPAEYDFRIEFTPQEAVGGGQYLTAFGRDFAWDFFAGAKNRACGFEFVDDLPLLQNTSCVMLSPVVAGRRYVSLVEVRRGSVRGFLDDQLVTERMTDYRDMSTPPYWKLTHENRLGLGCSGRMTFHRAELRGIGGRGRSAIPTAAPPPPPVSPSLPDEFMTEVAALPPDWQVERVLQELEKFNPGYDKKERHEIENGKLVMLALDSPTLARIGPVRALTTLQSFRVGSNDDPQGPRYRLADLGPLRGLPLTSVICNRTAVTDLSPLRGMALTSLKISGSPVSSLQPLRDMALLELDCRKTAVTDLSPLRKMPLRYLYCDLTVATNGPNRGVIRSLDKLKEINGITPDAFWKQPCDYTPPTGAPLIRRD